MKPEFNPGRGVKKAGNPESAGSTSMAIRRSAKDPISHKAIAIMSAAKATGSAWKFPPDRACVLSEKIRGLSDTPLASSRKVVAACRRMVRAAPITWGWQRRQ